jgi:putative transposase
MTGEAEAKEGVREEEMETLHAKIGRLMVERDCFGESVLSMSVEQRHALIEPDQRPLSIARQCKSVSIRRLSFYCRPLGETAKSLALMRSIDALFLEAPWYGSRQMAMHRRRDGHEVGRTCVWRVMATVGLMVIHQRPRTTVPHPE